MNCELEFRLSRLLDTFYEHHSDELEVTGYSPNN